MENSEPALKRPGKAGARKTPFQTKHALQLFALEPEERTEVLYAVGEILLSIVNGLSSIKELRDEVNNASTEGMPPCLLHELLALKPHDVVQLVLKFHDWLLASWNQNAIDLIVDQHKKLLNAVKKPKAANCLGSSQ
jgi:hypothetical protein